MLLTRRAACVRLGIAGYLACSISACQAPAAAEPPAVYPVDLGITLASITDEDVTLTSATDHDVHVLVFWATYCPCIGELGEMHQLYERWRERGLNIYAISVDGPATMSRVPGIAAQEKWTFPVLYDSDTRLMARYTPKGEIPFHVVLDAEGNILKTHQGYAKGDIVGFEQFILEHLDEVGGGQ